ncbi:hypothetical protein BDF14DRAFT_1881480 [Spinellus fusiger]|nr:hypothetical protein BDF14DRAFT_1881480 [Spinellus fusiger]
MHLTLISSLSLLAILGGTSSMASISPAYDLSSPPSMNAIKGVRHRRFGRRAMADKIRHYQSNYIQPSDSWFDYKPVEESINEPTEESTEEFINDSTEEPTEEFIEE